MRSDARYTALLVARGDDDEFRREDLAPSKDNSTVHTAAPEGRSLPACSTCGETTQITYTVQKSLALLAGANVRCVCAFPLSSSVGSRLLVPASFDARRFLPLGLTLLLLLLLQLFRHRMMLLLAPCSSTTLIISVGITMIQNSFSQRQNSPFITCAAAGLTVFGGCVPTLLAARKHSISITGDHS